MNLVSTQYTLKHKAFEIYFSGCTIHCKGCHNPELWDFNKGTLLDEREKWKIFKKIRENIKMINEIWFLGGEPLDQNSDEFNSFLHGLKSLFPYLTFVLFTGYSFKDIDKDNFQRFDIIKFGNYEENERVEDGFLISKNQKIWRKGENKIEDYTFEWKG